MKTTSTTALLLCVSVTPKFEEIARIIDVIAGKLWPLYE